jgi:hypothetical protein
VYTVGSAYSCSMAWIEQAGRGGWKGRGGAGVAAAGRALLIVNICYIDEESAQLIKGVLN